MTQLHLLVSAYPPTREDGNAYFQLVRLAIGVLNPLIEDSAGRNALFLLCEAMAQVTNEHAPENKRLVKLLLEQAPSQVTAADRTGRTVLDLPDNAAVHSSLSVVRPLLVDAAAQARGKSAAATSRFAWEAAAPAPASLSSWSTGKVASSVLASALEAKPSTTRAGTGMSTAAPSRGGGGGGGGASMRSYFDEEDDDEEESARGSLASHRLAGYPPASYKR